MRFAYPIELTPEADGSLTVSFPDLPEALTSGKDRVKALALAADCLEEALACRVDDGEPIPPPSLTANRPLISPRPVIAAKVALNLALTEFAMTNIELASRLRVAEGEVRRLKNFRHNSKIDRLSAALAALGKSLTVEIQDVA